MELLYFVSHNFKSGSTVPPHNHNCFELVFFYDCESQMNYAPLLDSDSPTFFNFSKKFNTKTNLINCPKNSFIILPPNVVHDEKHISNGFVYAIGFEMSKEESDLIKDSMILKSFIDNHGLILKINEIASEFSSHNNYSKEMVNALFTQLMIRIHRELSQEQTNDNNFEYVNQYLNQYFLNEIEIKKLAEQFNYSESHFRLLFKKYNGIPIGHYIINKKIEYVKQNMLDPNTSIKEIAETLGFPDYYSFSNFIKKHTGYYPRQYRKMLLKSQN